MEILERLSIFDQQLFLWLNERCRYRDFVKRAARLVSRTGDGYVQLASPALLWLFATAEAAQSFFLMLAFALVLERSIYWLLKNLLRRKRPPDAIPAFSSIIIASDEFSFPSGHTSAAFLLAIVAAAFLPIMLLPLLIWAATVGLSRVILGVHFPADVLAGAMLGSGIALAIV